MRYLNLLIWKHRTVTLSLVVAVATMVALLALSPSLVQGQNNDSPATMEECKDELRAGSAVSCTRNAFSVKMGRGKFNVPIGQPGSAQKPRM